MLDRPAQGVRGHLEIARGDCKLVCWCVIFHVYSSSRLTSGVTLRRFRLVLI
jgi:hypothetical protein